MEASTVESPAPVLITVVVVRVEANNCFVVGAGVVEAAIHVVDPASEDPAGLGGTNVCNQRGEPTILAAVVVPCPQATDVCVAIGVPVHVSIPAIDVAHQPVVRSSSDPARQSSLVLVGTLKFA